MRNNNIDIILIAHRAQRQERRREIQAKKEGWQIAFLIVCMAAALLSLPFI